MRIAVLLAVVVFCGGSPAQAQTLSRSADELGKALRNVFDLRPTDATDWRLGVGPYVSPAFEGSKEYKIKPAPVISVRYRDILTVDNNHIDFTAFNQVLDLNDIEKGRFEFGPTVNIDFGRGEGDSTALRGLGNVGFSVELGGFFSFHAGPAEFALNVGQDVAQGHKGMLADISVDLTLYKDEKFAVAGNAMITWASAAFMKSFFGITGTQSVASGLPVYRPGSGLKSTELSVVATYDFSKSWALVGQFGYKRMLGRAASSPLIVQRGSPNQASAGTFVVYKF